jgi:hypothetical protein
VCLEIARYLIRNGDAVDTIRGIADWWIKRDVPSTQEALLRLQECGIVESFTVQDSAFVYAYTRNPILRYFVTRCVARVDEPPYEGPMLPDRVKGL